MKTYKNKNFTKRDYEATNIVFAVSERIPSDKNYFECDFSEIAKMNCQKLWVANDVTYYGFL